MNVERAGSSGRQRLALAVVIGAIVLVLTLIAPDYGLTWDESQGDLFFGERYWAYWTQRDSEQLDFTRRTLTRFRQPGVIDLYLSPCRSLPHMFYPFANTLAAGTHALFHRALGLLQAIPAYHAVNHLLFAIFAWNLGTWIGRRFGDGPALGAVLLLLAHPRVLAHVQFNVKDVPTMCLFGLAVIHFAIAMERRQPLRLVLVAVLVGLTTATKANGVFLGVLFLAILIVDLTSPAGKTRPLGSRLWIGLAAMPPVALLGYYYAWPQAWPAFKVVWRDHFEEITSQGYRTLPSGLHFDAWWEVAVTTPPILLPFFVLGALEGLRLWRARPELRTALAALSVWLVVPLLRVTLPGMVNFDGIRHFIEFWPPVAVFVALGVAWTLRSSRILAKRIAPVRAGVLRWSAAVGVIVLVAVPPLAASVRTHPFQLAYFNPLLGGLGGAQARGHPNATDYWAASYLQGMRWLRDNAERPSFVVVPVAAHVARLYEKTHLPSDVQMIVFTNAATPEVLPQDVRRFSGLVAATERPPIYVMFVTRRSWYNEITELALRRGTEVMRIEVDGGVILKVLRL